MRIRRTARGTSLVFERFETRQAMAGNVMAQLIDGSLFLDGDGAANGVAIVATENPGEVRVSGTPATAGDTTELNGQDEPLTFVVTKDIVIRTAGGNDGVELNNVNVPRNLIIETGDGLDRVSIGYCTMNGMMSVAWPPASENVPGGAILNPQVYVLNGEGAVAEDADPYWYRPLNYSPGTAGVGRDLSVNTGNGADYVFLGHTHVGRDIALRTGDGDDNLIIHTASALNLDVGMGRGADLANITDLNTSGQMTLETGFGDDFVSYAASNAHAGAAFLGGHGNNQVIIGSSVFSGALYTEFGVDNDSLTIKSSMLLGNSTFVTGQGADRVDINYTFGRFVSANTGEQGDSFNVVGSALDNIFAALGDGDDQFSMVVSRILYPYSVDGGAGAYDLVHEYGNSAFASGLAGIERRDNTWPWWLM
jgi:hypothetical protein